MPVIDISEMQKEGDAGDAVSANFFQLCYFLGFACNYLHNFAHFCTILIPLLHILHIFEFLFAFFARVFGANFFKLKVVPMLFSKLFATL